MHRSSEFLTRLVLFFFVASIAQAKVTALASLVSSDMNIPPINVVVVGVIDYDSPDYKPMKGTPREETVGGQIERRCRDISSFFHQTYGDRATVHLLCSKNQTTKSELEKYFKRQFREDAKGTLSVVFFMSHGEQVVSDGSLITPDLRLITSDTTHEDPDLTSLSLTTDVMAWLQGVPVGATVIMFVDTCHSGAFRNIQVKRIGTLANDYGLYMNVMASALPQDKSYAAKFTKAILSIWGSKELCLNDASLPTRIRNLIQQDLPIPLDEFEGRPISVIRYRGAACLYSPVNDDRLVLLYAGANQPAMTYYVVSSPEDQKVMEGDLIDKSYEYFRVSKGVYDITINEQNAKPFTKHLDLTGANLTEIVYLTDQPSATAAAQANSLAADGALRLGHPLGEIAELRQNAANYFRNTGEFVRANAELAKLDYGTSKGFPVPPKSLFGDSQVALLSAKVLKTVANRNALAKTTIPAGVVEEAKCIVVVPSLSSGKILTGSRQGKGVATCRTIEGGWGNPTAVAVEGRGSRWSFAQGRSDIVMFIMNDHGKDKLYSEELSIGSEATAKPGPISDNANNATPTITNTDILGYSLSGGKLQGSGLSGTTIKRQIDTELPNSSAVDKAMKDLTNSLKSIIQTKPQ